MSRTTMLRPYIQDDHDAPGDATTGLWIDYLVQNDEPHEARLEIRTKTQPSDIRVDGHLLATYAYEDAAERIARHDFLWAVEEGLVRVERIWNGKLRIRVVMNRSHERAQELLAEIRQQVVPIRKTTRNEVRIKFWRMTPHGGASFSRNIAAPTWPSIQRNYAKRTALQLSQLMRLRPKQIGTGKVMLLHGPAGTGKTTAIRALAREWRRWCDFSYAIDPERIFGAGDYLTDVIADGNDDDDMGASSETPTKQGRWRLLIIEDAEEFLVPDAKHEVGQAVSRLLNVGDGILGQGLQLLVLLTTNVPVTKLSPAIIRPGRCLANIEVPIIPKTEASDWLGRAVAKDSTLAELWEMAHPSQIGTGLSLVPGSGQYL